MDNYQDWKPVVFNNVSKEAKEKQRIANAQKLVKNLKIILF